MAAIAMSTGSTVSRKSSRPAKRLLRAGGVVAAVVVAVVALGFRYWGKYVYHDNNRDINLSQVSMRALGEWYFTAHPPIMHDLHESLPLLYTYSGGPPQNPNLDPILFTELPFFSNFELAQMTKWGMPGVYTHAFMDGWSPGYLGSIAYNHNGMMRMYETQSGRESGPGGRGTAAAEGGGREGGGREGGAVRALAVGVAVGAKVRRRAQDVREDEARVVAAATRRPTRRRRKVRAAEAASRARVDAAPPGVAPLREADEAAPSSASGIAASRFLLARPTTSRGGTTPTTCRRVC